MIFLFAEVEQGRPPIKVKFEIPYFTVSGIQVSQNGIVLVTAIWKILVVMYTHTVSVINRNLCDCGAAFLKVNYTHYTLRKNCVFIAGSPRIIKSH